MQKRTATAIVAIIAAIAVVLGWCGWRRHVTSTRQPDTTVSQQAETKDGEGKRKVLNASQMKQNRLTALRFEQDMRNWGVDSLADPTQYQRQPADKVLAAFRTPDMGGFPDSALVGFNTEKTWGPDAASYVCLNGYETYCQTMPTAQSWWRSETWGIGTRWKTTPKAVASDDGTVRVTGTVRTVLVTSGDEYSLAGYNALTPAWKDYRIEDVLTVKGGKVTRILYEGAVHWWLNPYLSQWVPDNVADDIGRGTRIAIPVSGSLNWNGLNPTGITRVLSHPVTQGDLDGMVDWSMWEDIIPTFDNKCQNCPVG